MKKLWFFTALAAAAALYSCTRELPDAVPAATEGMQVTFRARMESCQDDESRTSLHYLNTSTAATWWQAGDKITILSNGGSGAEFTLDSGSGEAEATFTGNLPSTAAPFYAVYPSSLGATKGSGKINFTLSQTQTGSVTAANGMMPAVAYIPTADDAIDFMNLCGLLRLKLTAPAEAPVTVSRLDIYDLSGAMLWGDVQLTANATLADPSTWGWSLANGDNHLIIDFSDNFKTLGATAITFYAAVPKGALSQGVRVVIFNEEGVAVDEFCSGKDLTVERAHIKPMKSASVGTFKLLDLEGSANCYIASGTANETPYKFCAISGPGGAALAPDSVEDLWETIWGNSGFNGGNLGYVISDVAYDKGTVSFNTCGRDGCAVIAARNAGADILWSWHIWLPGGGTVGRAALTNGVVCMDRALGARYSSSSGFLYQWGRKDPFTAVYHTGDYSTLMTTNPANILTDELNMSADIAWSVAHPTTFIDITQSSSQGYWEKDNAATWDGAVKSQYDPCPPGWRVPSSAQFTGLSFGAWDATDFLYTETAASLKFVSSGRRYYNSQNKHTVDKATAGYLWTRTGGTKQATYMSFNASTSPKTANINKCFGLGVRCVLDE